MRRVEFMRTRNNLARCNNPRRSLSLPLQVNRPATVSQTFRVKSCDTRKNSGPPSLDLTKVGGEGRKKNGEITEQERKKEKVNEREILSSARQFLQAVYPQNGSLITALLPNRIRKTSAISGTEGEHVQREQYGGVSKY